MFKLDCIDWQEHSFALAAFLKKRQFASISSKE